MCSTVCWEPWETSCGLNIKQKWKQRPPLRLDSTYCTRHLQCQARPYDHISNVKWRYPKSIFFKGVFAKFWEYWHQGTNPGHFLKKEHAGGPQRLWISFSWTASWQEKTGWMLDICISLSAGCTHWPWSPPFDTILLSCCHPIPSNWLFLFIVINITTESIFRQHNSTDWSSVAMAPFCLWRLQSRDVPGKLGLVIAIDITEDAKMFSLFILTQSCSSALPVIQVCSMPQVM